MTAKTDKLYDVTLRTVVSIDAMGGDRGPLPIVLGMAASAKKNPELHFIVHGPKDELDSLVGARKVL